MEFAKPHTANPHLSILAYGSPGTGKTAFACSGAYSGDGGVLLLNLDRKARTRFARSKKRDPEGRIHEIAIPPFEAVDGKVKRHVLDLMGEISRSVAEPQDFFDWVVIDPIGELYRRLLEEESNRAIHLGTQGLNMRLAVTTHIERFCRFLADCPINSVFVCHELTEKDEATETFERLPFTGTTNTNLSGKIMAMVDIVAYTGVKQQEDGSKHYLAQLYPGGGRRGKDGFDALGDSRELDLAEWVRVIREHEGGEGGSVEVSTSRQGKKAA